MIERRLMLAGLKAFIVCLFLTPIVRDIFRSYNVVDRPGRRKVHAYPIPRVGGVPLAAAWLFTLVALFGPDSPISGSRASALLPGAAIIFLTGLLDDFFSLEPWIKLLGQIAAGAAVFAAGLRLGPVEGVTLPLWLNCGIAIFWLLLTTNALNLIDGLDGLCAGLGLVGALTFFAAGIMRSQTGLVWVSLPLVGALLGFLFHNFNPATVFLGDSGALLIGFLLGCLGLMWTSRGVSFSGAALPLLALAVPLVDLSLSVVRRSLKGQPIFSADRGHIHHRLLERGLSVRAAALTMCAAGVIGAYFGLLMGYAIPLPAHLAAALAFVGAAAFGVHRLRYPEFEVAGRLLFRREFHRVLADKSRLEYLARSLEKTQTEDEWWTRIVEAARDLKWTRVRRVETRASGERVLHEKSFIEPASGLPGAWSFHVELAPGEALVVEGDATPGRPGFDLPVFSAIGSATYRARSGAWLPRVLS
jgi:UDP-GlcNAc:undecaprenyl-phosphate GlcNAc-1-phosphate transferase